MTRWKGIAAVPLLVLLAAAAQAAPAREVRKARPQAAPAAQEIPAPAPGRVVLEGNTLFMVPEPALGISAEERARNISIRLEKLVKDRAVRPELIQVVEDEGVSLVVGEGKVLMAVFERDAAAEGVNAHELATRFARAIRIAIAAHNREFSFRSILFGCIRAFVATAVLLAFLLLYRFLFPRIYAGIRSWSGTRVRSIHVGSYELLKAARLLGFLVALARWFRILTTAALAYAWLLYVLSLFPWTRGISSAILDYILDPLHKFGMSVLEFLPNLFVLAVIAVITRYFIKLARFLFTEVEKGRIVLPRFYADWAMPTYKIVRFFVLAFALTVAFPYLPGSHSAAFKGVSIFLGVLFSLGSTSVVSNVMGGLSITYMRAYKVGDRVKVGDTVGDVIDKSLLVTHIRTIKNEEISVPNSMVLNAHVVNYSARARAEGLILHTSVTIGYDAPWRTVHRLLIEAARKTADILPAPEPFVLQKALNDFYVTYELNAYTAEAARMVDIYSELHRNIQDAFNEAGVEIMSPHYAQIRDGNRTAIPDEYLPPGYRPRAIRVEPVRDRVNDPEEK